MSLKISAMTPAAACSDSAVFPIVDGGANFSCTRQVFLTANAGEDINISAAGGNANVLLDSAGGVDIVFDLAVGFEVSDASNDYINVDTIGRVFISGQSEVKITHVPSGAQIVVGSPIGDIGLETQFGQSVILSYLPANSGDWAGDPVKQHQAIDRIAAAVAGILGGPIP